MANNNETKTATLRLNGQEVVATLNEIIKKAKETAVEMQKATETGDTRKLGQLQKQYNQCQQEISKMAGEQRAVNESMKNLGILGEKSLKQIQSKIRQLMMDKSVKQGSQEWNDYLKQLKKVEAELNKVKTEKKAAMSGNGGLFGNLNISGLTSGFGKLAGSLGLVVSGAGAAGKVLGDIYSLNKDFEQQMANLASVLGKSKEDVADLEAQAKRLGQTTMFTASEVAGLQVNLAKLGFNQDEIKESSRAILDFAAATGAALPEAAESAGAALRAFDMDTTQMERVVSTMAVATANSALDFEKLRTSIPTVFPVAKAFGFSIEDTVALLGKLSDAGFEASTAATATRNIMLNMANPAGKLAKALGRPIKSLEDLAPALKELKDRNIDLAEAFALTDKRSVAAFTRFVSASDTLVDLKDKITDCDEALRQMVDTRLNTLEGSTIKLGSAWQDLMLSFSKSTGPMKTVVDWLTKITKGITRVVSSISENVERDVNERSEARINKLKPVWQDQLSRLGLEDASADQLKRYMDSFDKTLSNAEAKADKYRKRISDIEKAIDLGIGTEQGVKLSGGLDIDQAKKEIESLTTLLTNATVDIQRSQYYIAAIQKAGENQKNGNGGGGGTLNLQAQNIKKRILTEQQAEEAAYAERVKAAEGNDEKLYEIEKEHWNNMYNAEISGLTEIAELYKENNPKLWSQYSTQAETAKLNLLKKLDAIEIKFNKKSSAQDEKDRKKALKDEITSINSVYKAKYAAAKSQTEKMIAAGTDELDAQQWLNDEEYRLKVETISKKMELYKTDSAEYEQCLNEMEKATEEHEQAVSETNNKTTSDAMSFLQHLIEKDNPSQKFKDQLAYIEKLHNQSLISEEQYQDAIDALQKAQAQKTVENVQQAMDKVSELMSTAAEFASAQYDLEIQQTENRYDKEIEAAEEAGKDTTEIEKQKTAAVNKLKLKQAEADRTADIAQTFIDAAEASMKVWVKPGWPWALALQAVIMAQQAMSIKTINQQYEAKKASYGYYEGGYTSGTDYHREAGVVHEGEFVANHNAVNNPEIRPMLDALDYAQKHNSVSALTSEDLALAAGYEAGGYTAGSRNQTGSNSVFKHLSETTEQLSGVLSEIKKDGIDAKVYTSGRSGLDHATKRKNILINNKSRIS